MVSKKVHKVFSMLFSFAVYNLIYHTYLASILFSLQGELKEQLFRMAEAGLGMTATKGCVYSVVKHVHKGAPVVAQRCKGLFYEGCCIDRKTILLLGCC